MIRRLIGRPATPNIHSAALRHCEFLSNVEGRAIRTLETRRQRLGQWCKWLDSNYPRLKIRDLKREHSSNFMEHLACDRNCAPRTINQVLVILQGFHRWLVAEQLLESDPTASIRHFIAPSPKPAFLSPEEANQLLNTPDHTTFCGFRNYALLLTFLHTGCRPNELVPVRCKDRLSPHHQELIGGLLLDEIHIDPDGTSGHIRVTGKRRATRTIPLTSTLANVLSEWLRIRAIYVQPRGSHYVWIGKEGEPLEYCTCRKTISRCGRRAGLPAHKCKAQVLRHTVGTWLYDRGTDVIDIARFLGNSPDVVNKYYVGHREERMLRASYTLDGMIPDFEMSKKIITLPLDTKQSMR